MDEIFLPVKVYILIIVPVIPLVLNDPCGEDVAARRVDAVTFLLPRFYLPVLLLLINLETVKSNLVRVVAVNNSGVGLRSVTNRPAELKDVSLWLCL